jgi:hypothetical protein
VSRGTLAAWALLLGAAACVAAVWSAGRGASDEPGELLSLTQPPAAAAASTSSAAQRSTTAGARAVHAAHGDVTIDWAGDTVLGSSYGMPPDGGRASLAGVARTLRAADLAWVNLEQALATSSASKCAGSANCYAFVAPPTFAGDLSAAGIDLVNSANNHAMDAGEAGERETIAALRAAGLGETGHPGEITVRTVRGIRVAFLGFAPYPWASPLDDIPAATALVRRAAARADLVVVAIHAGGEGSSATHVPHGMERFLGEDRGDSRAFAQAVVAAGADLVVGSGPHVIRGVQWIGDHLAAYSLGNFAGYDNFGLGGDLSESAILSVTLDASDGSVVAARWIPVVLAGPGLPRLDPSDASLHLVAQLSREDFGSRGARFASDGSILLPRRGAATR